jgi:hypothetical protein
MDDENSTSSSTYLSDCEYYAIQNYTGALVWHYEMFISCVFAIYIIFPFFQD